MPEYKVKDVISAAVAGQYLSPSGRIDSRAISLITDEKTNLGPDSVKKIEELLDYVEQAYKVKLKIVGGGRGCTKIDLEVHGTPENAAQFVSRLLEDAVFARLARDIGFRIVYSPTGPTNRSLPELSMGKQSTINVSINNSKVDNLQLDSDGSTIESSVTGPKNVESLAILIDTMHSTLQSIDARNDDSMKKINEDFEILKRELQSRAPRRDVVTPILSNLGSIASLAALADQVHKFLPRL